MTDTHRQTNRHAEVNEEETEKEERIGGDLKNKELEKD